MMIYMEFYLQLLFPNFLISYESVVTLTNDLCHVNQHYITHIMQKKIFFKNRFLGKNFFSDPIPHSGRITSDTNMEISSKCFFLVVLIKSSQNMCLVPFFKKVGFVMSAAIPHFLVFPMKMRTCEKNFFLKTIPIIFCI